MMTNDNLQLFLLTGKENARSRAKNEGGSSKSQGKVRECPARDKSVQSKVHGGHDPSF